MPITISALQGPSLWSLAPVLGSAWRIPGRVHPARTCASASSPSWGAQRPPSKTGAALCTRPRTDWGRQACAALVSPRARTLWLGCSSASPKSLRPFPPFCRPVVRSRAHASTRGWRVWRRPRDGPRRGVCLCTAWSPGPTGSASSRPPGAPRRARPEPSGALVWSKCPPAKPSSRGFEPMPQACWRARRCAKPQGSRTPPAPRVHR